MDLGKWFVNKILNSAQTMQGRIQRQNRVSGDKNGYVIEVVLQDVERLSVQLDQMTIRYQLSQRLSQQEFDNFLKQITGQITYLPETLKVIEKDDQNDQALLRSANPLKSEKDVEYFELLVNPQIHMKFTRMRNQDHENHPISFVMGFDILERLINDLGELINKVRPISP